MAARVAAQPADSEQVARSRQFPFLLAAYRAAPSLRRAYPLERALAHSLAGVPALDGRTLVPVDRSPSIRHGATPPGKENRHTFDGLTDAAFRMIPLLESGRNATWPF
ncbi:hypothetical protein [Streptosporangium sp. NPDC002607]